MKKPGQKPRLLLLRFPLIPSYARTLSRDPLVQLLEERHWIGQDLTRWQAALRPGPRPAQRTLPHRATMLVGRRMVAAHPVYLGGNTTPT